MWTVYPVHPELSVVVYRGPELGLIALFHDGNAEAVLAAVSAANDNPMALERHFQWPNGPKLTYNVHAPRNQWVMVAVDDTPLDREFDQWPWMRMVRKSR
jgi:hypothetical protein